jgi:DNA invertase Pin-like site-specific DNA recombinase
MIDLTDGPALLISGEKITASHRARDAYVYVRQSTLLQARVHTESLARQYDLRQRAGLLGWPAHQVVVIDEDLGRSGASAAGRSGFSELVADVGLGRAGIILALEVSRLARSNADWYQLLDLCALTDTLIADADGIYQPGSYNDRLILGLKGTMSEAELHLIRSRLTEGLRHKAARGELRQNLPVGLDYDPAGTVVITADEAVREAIATVYRRFAGLGSARAVLLSLRGDGLLLPRRTAGSGRITWAQASYPAVHDFLTNPAYAGAFVFGRTRTEKRVDASGRLITSVRLLPREQWAVLITDHHPGYVSWDTYEATATRLRANWRPPRGEGGGPPREGRALLQGLLRCGRCGRIMQTGYSGTAGNSPRYVCARAKQLYAGEHVCQSIGGIRLEQVILAELFKVLEPASLEATARALAEAEDHYRRNLAVFELAVERARYDAGRARRQYDAVEPENRLVARTLERAWEDKLAAARHAENDLRAQQARRPVSLTSEELAWITTAGADIKAVFHAPETTVPERKQLLRAVISEVVVTIHADTRVADLKIIWQGGAATDLAMPMTKKGGRLAKTTSEDIIDLVRRMAVSYDDKTIAAVLGKQHRRTATGLPWTRARVAILRAQHRIPAFQPKPGNVAPGGDDVLVVTISKAEKILGVSRVTLYRWLRDGFITGEQLTPGAPWQIRIDQALRDKIRPEAPDGWLPLDAAAKALGTARQTVLHKVQRGELQAVHVNRGRRKGLRIQVKPDQAGLFDTPDEEKGAVLTMTGRAGDYEVLGPSDPFQGGQRVLGGGGDRGLFRPPGGERLPRREPGGLAAHPAGGGVAAGDFLGEQDAQDLGGLPSLGAGGCEDVGGGLAQVGQPHPAHQGVELGRERRGGGAGHRALLAGSEKSR